MTVIVLSYYHIIYRVLYIRGTKEELQKDIQHYLTIQIDQDTNPLLIKENSKSIAFFF